MRGEEKSRGYRVIAEKVDDKVSARANISIENRVHQHFRRGEIPPSKKLGRVLTPPPPPFLAAAARERDDFTESPQSRFIYLIPSSIPSGRGIYLGKARGFVFRIRSQCSAYEGGSGGGNELSRASDPPSLILGKSGLKGRGCRRKGREGKCPRESRRRTVKAKKKDRRRG